MSDYISSNRIAPAYVHLSNTLLLSNQSRPRNVNREQPPILGEGKRCNWSHEDSLPQFFIHLCGHLLVLDIAHLDVGLVLMKTSLLQSYTNISIPGSNSQVNSFYYYQQPDISPPNHSAVQQETLWHWYQIPAMIVVLWVSSALPHPYELNKMFVLAKCRFNIQTV